MENEPAFPRAASPADHTDYCQDGMTLLDKFAAKAMQGDQAYNSLSLEINDAQLARWCAHYYRIAAAMMRARPNP